jgi:hypothetical protein
LCGGTCNLGPKETSTIPKGVSAYKVGTLTLNVILLCLVPKTEIWNYVIGANIFVGLVSYTLILVTQCRNPGIEQRTEKNHHDDLPDHERDALIEKEDEVNEKLNEKYLNQDPYETYLIEKIANEGNESGRNVIYEMFENTHLYFERSCITCNIARRPKVSHCRVCNNCVRAFDHHCTLLNTCIGERNIKTFVWMLLTEWIYSVGMSVLGVIFLLYEPFIRGDEFWNFNWYFIINCLVFGIVAIKFLFFICCRNKIPFGKLLIWMLLEILIVQVMCLFNLDIESSIAGAFTSCGTSIFMLSFPLVIKHLRLVSYRQSEKEYHARAQAADRLGFKGDPLRLSMSCPHKTKELFSFLFCCCK